MSDTNKNQNNRRSPTVFAVVAVAAAVILLSGLLLFRSVFSGRVLDTLESGSFRYELCGDGKLSQIIVYKDGSKTATVHTSSVGSKENHYGISLPDINFDGYPDLSVSVEIDGENRRYAIWIWHTATGTYRRTEVMDGIGELTTDPEYQCAISYTKEHRFAGEEDGISYYEDAQVYRIYRTVNGEQLEFARYEFVYYTKNDIYVYSVFRFDDERGVLYRFSEDRWMTEAEASDFDLHAEMKADMELHKAEYLPTPDTDTSFETTGSSFEKHS